MQVFAAEHAHGEVFSKKQRNMFNSQDSGPLSKIGSCEYKLYIHWIKTHFSPSSVSLFHESWKQQFHELTTFQFTPCKIPSVQVTISVVLGTPIPYTEKNKHICTLTIKKKIIRYGTTSQVGRSALCLSVVLCHESAPVISFFFHFFFLMKVMVTHVLGFCLNSC